MKAALAAFPHNDHRDQAVHSMQPDLDLVCLAKGMKFYRHLIHHPAIGNLGKHYGNTSICSVKKEIVSYSFPRLFFILFDKNINTDNITCIQRPPNGSNISGLLKQVVFKCRFY